MHQINTLLIASLFALLAWSPASRADLTVIVNTNNTIESLSKEQVQDLFLGHARTFLNGKFSIPFDNSALREEFYRLLTGKPIQQINAYWARLLFSGQTSPPTRLLDDASVLKAVSENEGGIGYIDGTHVDLNKCRILLNIKNDVPPQDSF